jgi:hypothetical protein
MDNLVHRKDFVLDKEHYFIQQPSEWETSRVQLGQEIRVADGAYDIESHITVAVESVPALMDELADYHVLPRYTDLLKTVDAVRAMVKEMERMDRDDQRGTLGYLRDALEANND